MAAVEHVMRDHQISTALQVVESLSRSLQDAGVNSEGRRPRGVGINCLVNPNGEAWPNEYTQMLGPGARVLPATE